MCIMFTLSVCMIVRDEEKTLDRILKCANQFADEIIIVDTGSKDNTVRIAEKYTDNIFHYTWCDHFGKARNFSFDKANCDYIMWLDADDYISDENIRKIINLKSNPLDVDVYMLKYVMGFKNDKPTFEFYRERIIKRSINLKWEGFIHESISPRGKIQYVDIEIEHRKEKANPPKRNLKIFENAITQGVTLSPRELYYYARELYYNNKINKCIKILNKFIKIDNCYEPNKIDAYIILGDIFSSKQDYIKSNYYLFQILQLYNPNSEVLCKIAKNFENLNQTEKAILFYKFALICPHTINGFISKEYIEFIPLMELCKLYYSINKEESRKYYNLAKTINPNHPSVIYNKQFFQ